MNDNNDFVNKIIVKLDGIVDDDNLKRIYNELVVLCNDYNIEKKCTEVGMYKGYLPEWYKIYFVSKKIEGMSNGSLQLYNLRLNDFFMTVNKNADDITPNDIRVYLYMFQQQRNVKNSTVANLRCIIHSFFEWSANEGYCKSNPCRSIGNIKYAKKPRSPLSDMNLERVRDVELSVRNRALLEFIYSTGCRVSEAEHVNISDVDFEKGEVLLFGKGSKYRKSYLSAKAELALKKYLAIRTDDNPALFVYDRRPYGRLQKAGIENIFRNIREKSGIQVEFYPHILRHTTATNCLSRGMELSEIQQMLGHANINTTMIYAKTNTSDVKHDHSKYII